MRVAFTVAGTVLLTSAIWLLITTATGFGARAGQTYYLGVGDSAEFRLIDLSCGTIHAAGGNVTLCDRPGTRNDKFVTFTGGWIKVWSEKLKPGANCCKTLLFSTPRNP